MSWWCAARASRSDRLPLPADVGQAIAAYLRRGRPLSDRREVFLSGQTAGAADRVRDGRLDGAASVSPGRGRPRWDRIGCGTPRLRDGLGRCPRWSQIAQVLRHHSLQSTAGLRPRRPRNGCERLAAPWPGSAAAVSALHRHVADYLRLRRALGFQLERAGLLLPQLVAYLEAAGASTVTGDLAIAWARLPDRAQPEPLGPAVGHRPRVRHLPADHRPGRPRCRPSGVFPTSRHRPTPYLWSRADIARADASAPQALRPPLRAATFQTAVRAARRHRHAPRRGGRPEPRRRRPRSPV